MKSQVLLTVWCNISGEAAGEIWHWSLSGVKGLRATMLVTLFCGSFGRSVQPCSPGTTYRPHRNFYQPLPFCCRPHTNHLYQPHTDHIPAMLTTYRPPLPTMYWPHTGHADHIPTTFTDHVLTTYRPCWPHTDRLYWPRTDHIPAMLTTYRPPLPTTYRPHTDRSTCPQLTLCSIVWCQCCLQMCEQILTWSDDVYGHLFCSLFVVRFSLLFLQLIFLNL